MNGGDERPPNPKFQWKRIVYAVRHRIDATNQRVADVANGILGVRNSETRITLNSVNQYFSPPVEEALKARVPAHEEVAWALIRALDLLEGWKTQSQGERQGELNSLTELLGFAPLPSDWLARPSSLADVERSHADLPIFVDLDPLEGLESLVSPVVKGPAGTMGLLCALAFSAPRAGLREEYKSILVEYVRAGGCYAIFVHSVEPKILTKHAAGCPQLVSYCKEVWEGARELVDSLGGDSGARDKVRLVVPRLTGEVCAKVVRIAGLLPYEEQRPFLLLHGQSTRPEQWQATSGTWISSIYFGDERFRMEIRERDRDPLRNPKEMEVRRRKVALREYFDEVIEDWRINSCQKFSDRLGDDSLWDYWPTDFGEKTVCPSGV